MGGYFLKILCLTKQYFRISSGAKQSHKSNRTLQVNNSFKNMNTFASVNWNCPAGGLLVVLSCLLSTFAASPPVWSGLRLNARPFSRFSTGRPAEPLLRVLGSNLPVGQCIVWPMLAAGCTPLPLHQQQTQPEARGGLLESRLLWKQGGTCFQALRFHTS